jgi:hypothetical protein
VDEAWDVVACCVFDGAALVLFVALARPACAFPAAEVLDFLVGQVQLVESSEEPCVVWKASEAHAVRAIAVVETRVFRFYGVEIAVEEADFDSHFLDEIQGEMGGERRRIIVPGAWEQMCVQKVSNGSLTAHIRGCGSGRALAGRGGECSEQKSEIARQRCSKGRATGVVARFKARARSLACSTWQVGG